jgi:hypothetical protein
MHRCDQLPENTCAYNVCKRRSTEMAAGHICDPTSRIVLQHEYHIPKVCSTSPCCRRESPLGTRAARTCGYPPSCDESRGSCCPSEPAFRIEITPKRYAEQKRIPHDKREIRGVAAKQPEQIRQALSWERTHLVLVNVRVFTARGARERAGFVFLASPGAKILPIFCLDLAHASSLADYCA